jgi:hypothetical protein
MGGGVMMGLMAFESRRVARRLGVRESALYRAGVRMYPLSARYRLCDPSDLVRVYGLERVRCAFPESEFVSLWSSIAKGTFGVVINDGETNDGETQACE